MNKKYLNVLFIISIFIIIFCLFNNDLKISISVTDTSIIFIKKVFPFLFIMMILNNILLEINFPYYINKLFKNSYIYIFILSIISGSPINAIIIKEYLEKEFINESEASLLLTCTCFNNPLFLYNYFNLLFNDIYIISKLFFIIYLSNLFLFIPLLVQLKKNNIKIYYKKFNTINILIISIKKTINNLINIFAIIVLFKLLCDIFITNNSVIASIIRGLIEITQGLNSLLYLDVSIKIKELLSIVILQFGSLSIHIQISNILNDYNINYKYFYLSRILLISISIIMIIII